MKYINKDNLYDYAFLNQDTLVSPLRAICVCFHGYTDATMYQESPKIAKVLGEAGIAWVFPYYSVWAWMSKSSSEFNEQVIDAVYERLGASENIPLIVSGGSMGGLTALNYLVYGKRNAVGCAVNCAVTDMKRIFSDIPDFRRAILSAHIQEDEDLLSVMKRYSPVDFYELMPRIPYYFVYGENDAYFTQNHMPPLIERMKKDKFNYELRIEEGMNHCDIEGHPDAFTEYCKFIIDLVKTYG